MLEKVKKINKRQWEDVVKEKIKEKKDKWKVVDRLVSWKERIYIPVDQEIRGTIIEIHHSWGHPGIDKMTELITQNYWWPGVRKDVQKHVQACRTCQTAKPDRQRKAAPLCPHEVPEKPWHMISINMMGPLLNSKGFDMILVVVDKFTKKSYFLPTNSTVTSKGIVILY